MKYIELFAGIGGFRYGIEKAYELTEGRRQGQSELEYEALVADTISKPNERQSSPTCVYANEWDKYAASVYERHYGHIDTTDIREVSAKAIPEHDLLTGGFPCQAFSVAGKRGGFEDTRGTLFFEIARILQQKQPPYLLLENVKGLLSHQNGRTFQTMLSALDELGYDCQWQVLNSKDFGVPQNRERVFIVGHLRGESRPKVFPLTGTDGKDIEQVNNPTHSNNRIYSGEGASPTLNTAQGGMRQPKIAVPVLTPDRAKKRQNGRRFKTNGEPSFTLTGQDKHGVAVAKQPDEISNIVRKGGKGSLTEKHAWDLVQDEQLRIRRLTPLETERLQGFPDGWTQYGKDGEEISDTQRYKMMGNAVTTNVITAIMQLLEKR